MTMSGSDTHSPAMMMEGDPVTSMFEGPAPSWTPPPGRSSASPRSRVGQSPIQQRKRSSKDSAKRGRGGITLPAPISLLTAHMEDIPIKDMDIYVNRSAAERQHDIAKRRKEAKDKNKVPRPSNAFILYRSAFTARIKAHMLVPNHQEISRIAGMSWKMETPEIKTKYENLASIERENHAAAHPNYKFTPQKGPATSRRVGEITPPSSVASGHMTDTDSPLWDEGYAMPPMPHRSASYDLDYASSSRGSTPFNDMGAYVGTHPYFPGYSTPNQSVEPSVLHGVAPHGLPFHHGSPGPSDMHYSSSNGLAGLPGSSHVDLLQPQPTHPGAAHIPDSGHVDPNLLFASSAPPALSSGPSYPEVPNSLPWEDEANSCYMTASHGSPSPATFHGSQAPTGYLPAMQHEASWDPSHQEPTFKYEETWLSDAHTPASSHY